MHDGVVRTLYATKLKKNLISIGTLYANIFGYKIEKDCIRVRKGSLIIMKGKRCA